MEGMGRRWLPTACATSWRHAGNAVRLQPACSPQRLHAGPADPNSAASRTACHGAPPPASPHRPIRTSPSYSGWQQLSPHHLLRSCPLSWGEGGLVLAKQMVSHGAAPSATVLQPTGGKGRELKNSHTKAFLRLPSGLQMCTGQYSCTTSCLQEQPARKEEEGGHHFQIWGDDNVCRAEEDISKREGCAQTIPLAAHFHLLVRSPASEKARPGTKQPEKARGGKLPH